MLDTGDSIENAMARAEPGTTIYLRGGTYSQSPNLRPAPGTADDRNILASYPGERAVIRGLPIFNDPDFWTFKDLAFTQGGTARIHLVKIHGGTGWTLNDVEIYGADQTGLLVGRSSTYGPSKNWTIKNSYFHDTGYTPAYLNPGRDATGGLVERNIFADAGTEDAKLGWGGTDVGSHLSEYGVGEVTFRYNTLVSSGSNANLVIAEPSNAQGIEAYRNLFVGSGVDWAVRIDNVEGQLGSNIWVHHNAYFGAAQFAFDFGDSPGVMGQMDANVKVDPNLDSAYRPRNGAAEGYGRYAP